MFAKVYNYPKAVGYLLDDVGSADTTITLQSGNGANFPSLGLDEYFMGTFVNTGEITKVTDIDGDVLTVVRAQETALGAPFATAHPAKSAFKLLVTAGMVKEIQDVQQGALTGTIIAYAGASAPDGYLMCDGAEVGRTDYASLFAICGTTYGNGDGSTTFNLPNLKGRVPAGIDASQTEFDVLGETGGAKAHTLTTGQMPAHNHGVTDPGHSHGLLAQAWSSITGTDRAFPVSSGSLIVPTPITTGVTNITIQNTGSGESHNNLQPYLVLSYIIKI